jgi:hypothetical protein
MFRIVTAQLIESGGCRQVDILRTFGVSKNSVIRSTNTLRQEGVEAFSKPRPVRYGGTILTAELVDKAQILLDGHHSRSEAASKLGVKYDTLRKAIGDGRLKEPPSPQTITTKSSRSIVDAEAAGGLGTACTRTEERIDAAFGIGNGGSFVLSLASMCRKEVRSVPCRHFWQTAFFMARNPCLAKSADIIVHCIFFCSWRPWPFVASKQLRNFEDIPPVSSENCWAWIVCRKFVACAKNWINSAKRMQPGNGVHI